MKHINVSKLSGLCLCVHANRLTEANTHHYYYCCCYYCYYYYHHQTEFINSSVFYRTVDRFNKVIKVNVRLQTLNELKYSEVKSLLKHKNINE